MASHWCTPCIAICRSVVQKLRVLAQNYMNAVVNADAPPEFRGKFFRYTAMKRMLKALQVRLHQASGVPVELGLLLGGHSCRGCRCAGVAKLLCVLGLTTYLDLGVHVEWFTGWTECRRTPSTGSLALSCDQACFMSAHQRRALLGLQPWAAELCSRETRCRPCFSFPSAAVPSRCAGSRTTLPRAAAGARSQSSSGALRARSPV